MPYKINMTVRNVYPVAPAPLHVSINAMWMLPPVRCTESYIRLMMCRMERFVSGMLRQDVCTRKMLTRTKNSLPGDSSIPFLHTKMEKYIPWVAC